MFITYTNEIGLSGKEVVINKPTSFNIVACRVRKDKQLWEDNYTVTTPTPLLTVESCNKVDFNHWGRIISTQSIEKINIKKSLDTTLCGWTATFTPKLATRYTMQILNIWINGGTERVLQKCLMTPSTQWVGGVPFKPNRALIRGSRKYSYS